MTLTKVAENDRYGCHGGDQFQPVGTVVPISGVYRYEKTFYFGVTCRTRLDLTWVDRYGNSQTFYVDLDVSGYGRLTIHPLHHPHIHVEDGQPGTILLTSQF